MAASLLLSLVISLAFSWIRGGNAAVIPEIGEPPPRPHRPCALMDVAGQCARVEPVAQFGMLSQFAAQVFDPVNPGVDEVGVIQIGGVAVVGVFVENRLIGVNEKKRDNWNG